MKIGVLGTGLVGNTIATKLVALGHEVKMGARSATNEKAAAWARSAGGRGSAGSFADAAAFGEIVFNCTNGAGTMSALDAAGDANLRGKILIDVSNPLDFSRGMPPTLLIANTDSLGEQVHRTHPDAKVVKALNTMNCTLMVDPLKVPDSHSVFISGNDGEAKKAVRELLQAFGWKDIIDLGDIGTARAVESYLSLWLALWKSLGTAQFNIKVVR